MSSDLLIATNLVCIFTVVWVYVYARKIDKASQQLINSNRELRHFVKGLVLGKGCDPGDDE